MDKELLYSAGAKVLERRVSLPETEASSRVSTGRGFQLNVGGCFTLTIFMTIFLRVNFVGF